MFVGVSDLDCVCGKSHSGAGAGRVAAECHAAAVDVPSVSSCPPVYHGNRATAMSHAVLYWGVNWCGGVPSDEGESS